MQLQELPFPNLSFAAVRAPVHLAMQTAGRLRREKMDRVGARKFRSEPFLRIKPSRMAGLHTAGHIGDVAAE